MGKRFDLNFRTIDTNADVTLNHMTDDIDHVSEHNTFRQ